MLCSIWTSVIIHCLHLQCKFKICLPIIFDVEDAYFPYLVFSGLERKHQSLVQSAICCMFSLSAISCNSVCEDTANDLSSLLSYISYENSPVSPQCQSDNVTSILQNKSLDIIYNCVAFYNAMSDEFLWWCWLLCTS